MSATKRVRWECPNGLHPGVLASTRPRKNATARYCLACSEEAGVLVERTAPALERKRNAKTAVRQDRAERKREQERAAKAAALLVAVIDPAGNEYTLDAGELLREAWRTDELRSQQRDAWSRHDYPPPVPELVIRRGAAGRGRDDADRQAWLRSVGSASAEVRLRDKLSGHACGSGERIVLTVRPGLGAEWLRAVIVHEAAHAACPRGGHGGRWRRAYVRAVRELYPEAPLPPLPEMGGPAWRLDEYVAEALLGVGGMTRMDRRKWEKIAALDTGALRRILANFGPEDEGPSPWLPLAGLVHLDGIGQVPVAALRDELATRERTGR